MSGRALAAYELGQTKVEHLHQAIVADHDVVGFDVAVKDAFFVRSSEGVGRLARDFQCSIGFEPSLFHQLAERLALD